MKNVKTLKEKIQNEIANGNLFAYNDDDGGIEEAINCGNVTVSRDEAIEKLAESLYNDTNFTWQSHGFTKAEWYKHQCLSDSYNYEVCHTWIYDLKEYLEEIS
jgi:hypothetical protein